MTEHTLKTHNLTVSYGKDTALWDVSFTIHPGKLVGILGPNGAGKSTLIKAILEFTQILSGSVEFFGGLRLKQARKRIAYVPQAQSVDWEFPITAFEVVLMGAYHSYSFFKRFSAQSKIKARQLLEQFGMQHLSNCPISDLSGGQKQKLFIARALMQDADLYFLDEPFAGIDHTTQQQILTLFKHMRDEGKTLIMVHHDLATVEEIFDEIILLNTYLVACGPAATVFTHENLQKTYGHGETILEKLLRVSKDKQSGFSS